MTHQWIVRPIWKPTEREKKVLHQIIGECIREGFGVRQIMEYFNLKQYYIYQNVPVKMIYREKRLAETAKKRLL